MVANRLRIALALIATIVVALSPSAISRGQEASPPPVADPAAPPAALDPPATETDPAAPLAPPLADPNTTPPLDPDVVAEGPVASPPTLDAPAPSVDDSDPARPKFERRRPTIAYMGRSGLINVELHPGIDATPIEEALEAAGFDILGSVDRNGWTNWKVNPPSEADLAVSERQLRAAVGREAKVRSISLDPSVVQRIVELPTRRWFFKWASAESRPVDQIEKQRVAQALVDSTLDIRRIYLSEVPGDDNCITIESPRTEIPKIEEFVRTLIKEPTFWRPPQWEKYYADLSADEATQNPAPADPTIVSDEPAEPAEESAAEVPPSPALNTKFLLLETDWEKANDREAALSLAHSTWPQIFDLNQAGKELFPAAYVSVFGRDDAGTFAQDMENLGLIRQTLPTGALDLDLADDRYETLGGVEVSFPESAPDGSQRTATWNLLVLARTLAPQSVESDPSTPPTDQQPEPIQRHLIVVVGWKKGERSAAGSGNDAAVVQEERYVRSMMLLSDESALIPIPLPGIEGLTAVISEAELGPSRPLGPRGGMIKQQGLLRFSIDWDDLIRAYEASPIGLASVAIDAMPEADDAGIGEITLSWRPADETQMDIVANAVKQRYPQTEISLRQFQGVQGATLAFRTPANSIEELKKFVHSMGLTNAIVRVGGTKPKQEPADDESRTMILHLQYAASGDTVKLLDSLKLDPRIRLASDDRTNSIILSAPDATKYEHVQAVIELVKELDRKIEAGERPDPSVKSAQPDRAANAATIRTQLATVERNVQAAAAAARGESEKRQPEKTRALRDLVTQAFRLRLDLQREEAAELRDRLAKIDENLERRERIGAAVVERRIEILLDPALEWPDVALEEASAPPAVAASSQSSVGSEEYVNRGTPVPQQAPDLQRRGDAFSAATSLAVEIGKLTDEAKAIESSDSTDGSEVRLALIHRQLDLLRQEFDARQESLKLELAALKANLDGAQANYERTRTLIDTGALSQGEAGKAEAELKAAQSDVARLEVILQQYDRARASLPKAMTAESETSEPGDRDLAPVETDAGALQGTWRIIRYSMSKGPFSKFKQTVTWQFDGEKLLLSRRPQPEGLTPATYTISHSHETPGVFLQQEWEDDAPILHGRFEVRGASRRGATRSLSARSARARRPGGRRRLLRTGTRER